MLSWRRAGASIAVAGCLAIDLTCGQAVAAEAPPSGTDSAQDPGSANKDSVYSAARAAAEDLPPADLQALQRDLIWSGSLNSLASGAFGRHTFEAIRAVQRAAGQPGTGVLTPPQKAALKALSLRTQAAYGFRPVSAQGITVGYPAKLATQMKPGRHGPVYSAPGSSVSVSLFVYPAAEEAYEALFARLAAERAGRTIAYSLLKPDVFVISGTSDGGRFYKRFLKTQAGSSGFVVGWDPKLSPAFDRVPIAMADSLTVAGVDPTPPAPTAAPAVPAPARLAGDVPVPLPAGAPREPMTGVAFAVSDAGDLVTSARLVAGCREVQLDGGSPGRVVAGDAQADIALVHAQAAAHHPTIAWRGEPARSGEPLTRVFAEGGRLATAPTSVQAEVGTGGDTRLLAVGPGAGGAVFDASGATIGLVQPGGQAIKARFATAFLKAHGIAPVSAPPPDPQASALVLTCTPG